MSAKQRLILGRFILDLMLRCQTQSGGDLITALVCVCVLVGSLERKPRDKSSIAALTGLSRQTVARRLSALQAKGRIVLSPKGRRMLAHTTNFTASEQKLFQRLAQQLHRAVANLARAEEASGTPGQISGKSLLDKARKGLENFST
jgi:DNA-binding HxlR family transcriptional regulator